MDAAAEDAESVARKGDVFLAGRALPKDEVDEPRRTETPFDYLLPSLKSPGATCYAATCSASQPGRRGGHRDGFAPLSEEELRRGNSPEVEAALQGGGFLQHTPLWYYLLKEAEVRADGNSLGELGSRIVCGTIIGLLLNDRNSFLNGRGPRWAPADAVRLPNGDPIVTIRDFLRFAGVMA